LSSELHQVNPHIESISKIIKNNGYIYITVQAFSPFGV
jgi:dienelactone hydrolase